MYRSESKKNCKFVIINLQKKYEKSTIYLSMPSDLNLFWSN